MIQFSIMDLMDESKCYDFLWVYSTPSWRFLPESPP